MATQIKQGSNDGEFVVHISGPQTLKADGAGLGKKALALTLGINLVVQTTRIGAVNPPRGGFALNVITT